MLIGLQRDSALVHRTAEAASLASSTFARSAAGCVSVQALDKLPDVDVRLAVAAYSCTAPSPLILIDTPVSGALPTQLAA
eukprot:6914685-Prymnesium_polylepis.1